MDAEKILTRINKLNRQVNEEVRKLENDGYQVVSVYNRGTGRDELMFLRKG
jgi:hypothetical protein